MKKYASKTTCLSTNSAQKGLKRGDLILFVEYSKIVKIAKSYIPAKKNPNNTVIEFDRFMEGICIRHNNGILEYIGNEYIL